MNTKVLVCLSGGLDSALVLDMMRQTYEVEALLFDYGQPHVIELESARRISERAGIPARLVRLGHVPKVNDVVFAGRNLVLASHAVSIAAAEDFAAVAMGCNQSDWARFPDCRPAFWLAVNNATVDAYGISVVLPLLRMTKSEVVAEARRRGIRIEDTWSCYDSSVSPAAIFGLVGSGTEPRRRAVFATPTSSAGCVRMQSRSLTRLLPCGRACIAAFVCSQVANRCCKWIGRLWLSCGHATSL
jgi:7-cyano-7-deazaguanine synthase